MRISVCIPSFGRPGKLITCLTALAEQTEPPDEILVGLDGASEPDAGALADRFAGSLGPRLRVLALEKLGVIAVRRRLLEAASGDVFLSLNDDVKPSSELVAAHRQAHRSHNPAPAPIVIGPAPFAPVPDPTLFDRLAAESDLVFFDPLARRTGPRTYRDCCTLNMSMSTAAARDAGGFPDLRNLYGYEDIELARRVIQTTGAEISFEPAAAVVHDHRLAPADVLRREYELGRAARAFAELNPMFMRELLRRDVLDPKELRYAQHFLRSERRDAERLERSFLALADEPAGRLPQGSPLLPTLAEHWILLKRYLWRWGLLDALAPREPRWSLLQDAPALP